MDRLNRFRTTAFFCAFLFFIHPHLYPSAETIDSASLTVFSEAVYTQVPDIGVVTLYFTAFGWKVDNAKRNADKLIKKFTAELEKSAIKTTDLRVGEAKLKPSTQFNRDLKANVTADFIVSRKVTLTVADTGTIEKIMDLSLSIGSFALGSVRLSVKDVESLKQSAFNYSYEQGRKKAAAIARSLSMNLGEPLKIEEINTRVEEVDVVQSAGFSTSALADKGMDAPENKLGDPSEQPAKEEIESDYSLNSPNTDLVQASSKLKITFALKKP